MQSSLENFIQGFSIFKVVRNQVIICQDCSFSGSSLGTEHSYEISAGQIQCHLFLIQSASTSLKHLNTIELSGKSHLPSWF